VLAPLALFLLPRQVGDQLGDELTARLPQAAQLIKHQRRVSALGGAQPPLERVEHLLDALGGRLLLLDEVLEAEGSSCSPA